MAVDPTLAAQHAALLLFGVIAMLFAARAIAVLRRPPTGEAGRELVFLNARDLIPAVSLVGVVVAIELLGWTVQAVTDLTRYNLPNAPYYVDLVQAFLLLVAGILAYRVLVPYTRSRRSQRSRLTLDRLAARVALLKGRR